MDAPPLESSIIPLGLCGMCGFRVWGKIGRHRPRGKWQYEARYYEVWKHEYRKHETSPGEETRDEFWCGASNNRWQLHNRHGCVWGKAEMRLVCASNWPPLLRPRACLADMEERTLHTRFLHSIWLDCPRLWFFYSELEIRFLTVIAPG